MAPFCVTLSETHPCLRIFHTGPGLLQVLSYTVAAIPRWTPSCVALGSTAESFPQHPELPFPKQSPEEKLQLPPFPGSTWSSTSPLPVFDRRLPWRRKRPSSGFDPRHGAGQVAGNARPVLAAPAGARELHNERWETIAHSTPRVPSDGPALGIGETRKL